MLRAPHTVTSHLEARSAHLEQAGAVGVLAEDGRLVVDVLHVDGDVGLGQVGRVEGRDPEDVLVTALWQGV